MECKCGSFNCRKVISGFAHLSEELQKEYKFFKQYGGIKKFMNYHGINATDSGGFQMYKDAFLIKTSREGVLFRSPFDGTKHFITPERDMEIQMNINSSIIILAAS